MTRIDRGVSSEVNTAIARAVDEALARVPWDTWGPPLLVNWTVAGEKGIKHHVGAQPHGVIVHAATGAMFASRYFAWTPEVAYLTAPVVGTNAVVQFYTMREAPPRTEEVV